MFNFCCIHISTLKATIITMYLLCFSNQQLHETTPRVCYILSTSSTNVNMYIYNTIPQVGILITSWPTQTEKFLSPTMPPWTINAMYKYASRYKLLNFKNSSHSIMHLRSAYQTAMFIYHEI